MASEKNILISPALGASPPPPRTLPPLGLVYLVASFARLPATGQTAERRRRASAAAVSDAAGGVERRNGVKVENGGSSGAVAGRRRRRRTLTGIRLVDERRNRKGGIKENRISEKKRRRVARAAAAASAKRLCWRKACAFSAKPLFTASASSGTINMVKRRHNARAAIGDENIWAAATRALLLHISMHQRRQRLRSSMGGRLARRLLAPLPLRRGAFTGNQQHATWRRA